jgi:hypothetical protein
MEKENLWKRLDPNPVAQGKPGHGQGQQRRAHGRATWKARGGYAGHGVKPLGLPLDGLGDQLAGMDCGADTMAGIARGREHIFPEARQIGRFMVIPRVPPQA